MTDDYPPMGGTGLKPPKKVIVQTFTDNNVKYLQKHMFNSSNYLNTFVKDEHNKIAQEFLTQISQAFEQARLDALAKADRLKD